MQLTDLGFLFLLLPCAVAFYYCVPTPKKPSALLVISIFFLFLIDQRSFLLLLCSVGLDCLLLWRAVRARQPMPIDFCIAQHVALLAVFGVALPLLFEVRALAGLWMISLSAIEMLIALRRGRAEFTPIGFASSVLFFGRIYIGPVGAGRQMLFKLRRIEPSLSSIARGTMLLISGVAKQVVISGEFIGLFRTLSHLPLDRMAVLTGWFYALCCALGLYFVLSGYSDIAQGIGLLFSMELPRTLYYPLQAKNLREHFYRFNMPLEELIYRVFAPGEHREEPLRRNYLISASMPILIGLIIAPTGELFLWSILLALLGILDYLLLRKLPSPFVALSRCTTFLLVLPSYLLLLPVPLARRLTLMGQMFGLGAESVPLYNSTTFYLLGSNLVLLLVGGLCCISFFDHLGKATARQFPQLWWVTSSAGHIALLVVTTSFLLWNVR